MPRGSKRPPNAGVGRKKGVPNKNTTAIKDMLREALDQAGGAAYLLRQAEENPTAFLALVAKLIPSEIAAKVEGNITLGSLVVEASALREQQS